MKSTRSLAAPALAAIALLLTPAPARAAGTLTGLSLQPNPAEINQGVQATLSGQGSCPEVTLDYGDGSPAQKLAPVDFNKSVNTSPPPHKFAAAKTYTVTASPGKGCQGSATANLTVKAKGGADLPSAKQPAGNTASMAAANILKALAAYLVPKVTGGLGLVEPGMTFIAFGSGFGSTMGKGTLTGDFGSRQLNVVQWAPKGIGFQVPSDIAGVSDHTAKLVVETSGGQKSEPFALKFRAKRDVVRLKAGDVGATTCAATAQQNTCNWTVKMGPGATVATNEPWTGCVVKAGASLCGWHEGAAGLGMGLGMGTDQYQISLKNGWALYDLGGFVSGSLYNEKVATLGAGFTEGATSWSPKVNWHLGKGQLATYSCDIFIVGPKGVPYK
ncbi:MAG: hypothetical protein Q8R92_20795 [Deltaproteobacteria bacterium]|nr:hypothetical protein [Deltaproteobacteria bacterium]